MLERVKVGVLAVVLSLAGCAKKEPVSPPAPKVEEKKPAHALAVPTEVKVQLDPFWGDAALVQVGHDKPCPEGLWALFPGEAPGKTPEEKKENEAGRAAYAQTMRSATFVAQFRGPSLVKLGEFEQGKGVFPLEVQGVIFCHDPGGKLISISFSPDPKPYIPGDREVGEHFWRASPLMHSHAVVMAEAKDFRNRNALGLDARVVFKPGRMEVHKKLEKIEESAEEAAERKKHDIPKTGGGTEDFGAGRLLHAQVQGVRVATNQSRTVLAEQRNTR